MKFVKTLNEAKRKPKRKKLRNARRFDEVKLREKGLAEIKEGIQKFKMITSF